MLAGVCSWPTFCHKDSDTQKVVVGREVLAGVKELNGRCNKFNENCKSFDWVTVDVVAVAGRVDGVEDFSVDLVRALVDNSRLIRLLCNFFTRIGDVVAAF